MEIQIDTNAKGPIKDFFVKSGVWLANNFNYHFQNRIQELILVVADNIGITKDDLLSRFKKTYLYSDPDLNGWVSTSDNWKTFDMHINYGIDNYCFQMAKIFATPFKQWWNPNWKEKGDDFVENYIAKMTENILEAFYENKLHCYEGLPLGDLTPALFKISEKMMKELKLFILAHEFGHVVMNMKNIDHQVDSAIENLSRASEKVYKEAANKYINANWVEECVADLIGINLSMNRHNDDDSKIFSYACAELFLIIINMLEAYHGHKFGRWPEYKSHPPSSVRLLFLRESKPYNNPTALMLGKEHERISYKILGKIMQLENNAI